MVQSKEIDANIDKMITQTENDDEDSDTHSENTTDSIPGLTIRKREDDSSCDNSSCDNTIEYDTDNNSGKEPDKSKTRPTLNMNPCEAPPSTIHISCRDFGDSDSGRDSSDSDDEDDTPKLAHRYNAQNTPERIEHKPLRLQGGCDPVEIHTRPPQVGTIRVETVENPLTDDNTS